MKMKLKNFKKSGFFLNFEIQFFALVEIETNFMEILKYFAFIWIDWWLFKC